MKFLKKFICGAGISLLDGRGAVRWPSGQQMAFGEPLHPLGRLVASGPLPGRRGRARGPHRRARPSDADAPLPGARRRRLATAADRPLTSSLGTSRSLWIPLWIFFDICLEISYFKGNVYLNPVEYISITTQL